MSLKATKPVSVYLSLSIVFFSMLVFIATFCVLLVYVGMCSLLVVLVKWSLLAK